jgi:hypothetical protein
VENLEIVLVRVATHVEHLYDVDMKPPVETRVSEVCGLVNAQTAALIDLVGEAIESGACVGHGLRSPAHWVAWQMGVSLGRAHEYVRVAGRIAAFPVSFETFRRGELTFDQVAAVTRAQPWMDERLCGIATCATVVQINKIVRAYRDERPETHDDDAPSQCALSVSDDGRLRLIANLDAEGGAIVDAALAEARDALIQGGRSNVTWADALIEIAERSLDTVTSPERRNRFRVNVHLDGETTTFTKGYAVPRGLLDLICCDAVIQPVWERDGVPVSIGRAQRTIPERTRRMIERRDRGCRVPGCSNHRWLDVHHIRHWADGGSTDTHNLTLLCRADHKRHHQGKLGISGNADHPDGLIFTDEFGDVIRSSGSVAPPTGPPPRPDGRYEHPTGERLYLRNLWLQPPAA